MNEQLQEANTNLKTAYDQLEEATTARERIESELRIARDIQMGMVPSQFPQHRHFDIYGMLKPAKEVGGDLYDFFIQNNKLYFCIGDVSGKGIPASLFMSVIVNLFRMVAKEGFPPEYIATRLNETVSENNENGMFCTMFIGEIDVQSGKLLYCNAGHNPPVMMARRLNSTTPTAPVFVEMEANAPIGLWPNLVFKGEVIEHIKGRPLMLSSCSLAMTVSSMSLPASPLREPGSWWNVCRRASGSMWAMPRRATTSRCSASCAVKTGASNDARSGIPGEPYS